MTALLALDFSVLHDAASAGVIGLLAGMGGGWLYCWGHHKFSHQRKAHKT